MLLSSTFSLLPLALSEPSYKRKLVNKCEKKNLDLADLDLIKLTSYATVGNSHTARNYYNKQSLYVDHNLV